MKDAICEIIIIQWFQKSYDHYQQDVKNTFAVLSKNSMYCAADS